MDDLRVRLNAMLAGRGPKPRGNSLHPAAIQPLRRAHKALGGLFERTYHDQAATRVSAPSELLPPLP